MKVKIEISCDNAAFENDPATEVERILRNLTGKLRLPGDSLNLFDINGNKVGKLEWED
jgi:hypothetical protein